MWANRVCSSLMVLNPQATGETRAVTSPKNGHSKNSPVLQPLVGPFLLASPIRRIMRLPCSRVACTAALADWSATRPRPAPRRAAPAPPIRFSFVESANGPSGGSGTLMCGSQWMMHHAFIPAFGSARAASQAGHSASMRYCTSFDSYQAAFHRRPPPEPYAMTRRR